MTAFNYEKLKLTRMSKEAHLYMLMIRRLTLTVITIWAQCVSRGACARITADCVGTAMGTATGKGYALIIISTIRSRFIERES